MPMLEVSHLKKNFATQKAVDDISFSVEKGAIFGLLGPNGAGKTTLIRMITGIFYPDAGEIFFDGKPFDPESDASRIGYMPEERGLYKKMKIGEQAVYLARLKGLSKSDALDRVRTWFQKFGMESWWNRKIEDLSKGMAQKLQFVTTVLHEPSLIILDEPFSGLDPVNANLIKEEIFGLARRGATILFSTHRMEQVEEICQQIVLVNRGQKILDGDVGEIRAQFRENLFRVALEGRTPSSSPLFTILGASADGVTISLSEGVKPNDVLHALLDQGAQVVQFREILPSLNEIFIRLVEGTPLARQFQKNNA